MKNKIIYNYNNKNIIILSVNHDKLLINVDKAKELLNYDNVCYFLETDYRKNNQELKKPIGDKTTDFFIKYLSKYEIQKNIKKCIKGWDIRQSILTQQYQDHLHNYKGFLNLNMKQLKEQYIDKIPNENKIVYNINNKIIEQYLNYQYQIIIKSYKNYIELLFEKLKEVITKYFIMTKIYNNHINNFILKSANDKNIQNRIYEINEYLKNFYANYSDIYLLEQLFYNNKNSNSIAFVGAYHFDFLQMHITNIKNDILKYS